MTKAKMYFGLSVTMAILAVVEAVSGFILWFGFPQGGGGGGRGWGGGSGTGQLTFWELSKHTWVDIHDWVAVALIVMVIVHVILHRKWIVRMAKSLFRRVSTRLDMNAAKVQ